MPNLFNKTFVINLVIQMATDIYLNEDKISLSTVIRQ